MMEASKAKTTLGKIRIAFGVAIKLAGTPHQDLRHRGEHPPITPFIGIGKVGSGQTSSESEMILQSGTRVEAGNDVAQAFAISQLAKAQGQKMIISRKTPRGAAHRKPFHTPTKSVVMEASDNLGKHGFKDRHRRLYRLRMGNRTHTQYL